MRRLLIITPAALLVLALWGGMHHYAYQRLAAGPGLPEPWREFAGLVLAGGFLSAFAAFSRALPRPLAGPVHVGAFGWMGALFVVDSLLAAGDLVRLLAGAEGLDAARAQAVATGLLGLSTVTYAIRGARRDPPLTHVEVRPARWPAALDGLKVVQLSDVHVSPDTDPDEVRRLVARVNELSPDVIALTGDLVDGSVPMLRAAMQPFAQLRASMGVYAVTGNHEYYSGGDAWIAELRRLGVTVLQNERVTLRRGEGAFELAGVPDWTGGQFGAAHRPRLADALAGRDESIPVVLLAHQPKQFPEAMKQGVSLQLSGHTHGGQIWPFTLLVMLAERHVAGLHAVGGSQLYVSRGTRYWGPPMRLGAPHELTVLTLRAG